MPSTTFTSGTPVTKEWLNDVNKATYGTSPFPNDNLSYWPDLHPNVQMHRVDGRLFMGKATASTGNRYGTQNGPIPDGTVGANWAIRDSQVMVFSNNGSLAISGFSRNGDFDPAQPHTAAIGVSGFVIANYPTTSVWGLYSDVQFEQGRQGYGIEIAVKNREGVNRESTPYFQTTGTYGIWLPGGGDPVYGGSPTHPNNTAIAIGRNSSTWNRGIVFFKDSITGTDGTTGTGTAIELAKGHIISWRAPGNYGGFHIRSDVSNPASNVSLTAVNNGIAFTGTAGGNMAVFSHTTNGVNYLNISNGANGAPVTFQSVIGDTDTGVDIRFIPAGTGLMRFGTWASTADAPINGYITIRDNNGTTRKLATIA